MLLSKLLCTSLFENNNELMLNDISAEAWEIFRPEAFLALVWVTAGMKPMSAVCKFITLTNQPCSFHTKADVHDDCSAVPVAWCMFALGSCSGMVLGSIPIKYYRRWESVNIQ